MYISLNLCMLVILDGFLESEFFVLNNKNLKKIRVKNFGYTPGPVFGMLDCFPCIMILILLLSSSEFISFPLHPHPHTKRSLVCKNILHDGDL